MKRNYIVIAFFSIALFVRGQEKEVKFLNIILPDKNYTTYSESTSVSTLDFIGNAELIEMMRGQGMETPFTVETKERMKVVVQTGAERSDSQIPFKMRMESMTAEHSLKGETEIQENPLQGAIITGVYYDDNKIRIDSISNVQMSPEFELMLKNITENLSNSIKYPEVPMKPGDSFKQETPLEIPMQGAGNLSCMITTVYLLKELKGNTAYFDLTTTIVLTSGVENVDLVFEGGGTGTMEYDIEYMYMTRTELNMLVKALFKTETFQMLMDVNLNSLQRVEIK